MNQYPLIPAYAKVMGHNDSFISEQTTLADNLRAPSDTYFISTGSHEIHTIGVLYGRDPKYPMIAELLAEAHRLDPLNRYLAAIKLSLNENGK